MPNTPAWGRGPWPTTSARRFPTEQNCRSAKFIAILRAGSASHPRPGCCSAPAAPRGGTRVGSRIDRERFDKVAGAMPPLHFSLRSLRVARRHRREADALLFSARVSCSEAACGAGVSPSIQAVNALRGCSATEPNSVLPERIVQRGSQPMEPFFFRPLPYWKRAVDIVGAVLFLWVASPLYLLIAVLIKLTSGGPVLFRQIRVGLGGRRFSMYKFRTMVEDAETLKDGLQDRNEQDGPVFKIRNDPHVTRLGRFLRKFSLDEFPRDVERARRRHVVGWSPAAFARGSGQLRAVATRPAVRHARPDLFLASQWTIEAVVHAVDADGLALRFPAFALGRCQTLGGDRSGDHSWPRCVLKGCAYDYHDRCSRPSDRRTSAGAGRMPVRATAQRVGSRVRSGTIFPRKIRHQRTGLEAVGDADRRNCGLGAEPRVWIGEPEIGQES